MVLLAVAVGGMVLLNVTAFFAPDPALAYDWLTYHPDLLFFCAVNGGVIGAFSSPMVIDCLRRKDLRLAVPLVYGPSLATIVAFLIHGPTVIDVLSDVWRLYSASSMLVSVSLWSVIAWLALPNKYSILPHICPACGYDRRGSPDRNCPECGAT